MLHLLDLWCALCIYNKVNSVMGQCKYFQLTHKLVLIAFKSKQLGKMCAVVGFHLTILTPFRDVLSTLTHSRACHRRWMLYVSIGDDRCRHADFCHWTYYQELLFWDLSILYSITGCLLTHSRTHCRRWMFYGSIGDDRRVHESPEEILATDLASNLLTDGISYQVPQFVSVSFDLEY